MNEYSFDILKHSMGFRVMAHEWGFEVSRHIWVSKFLHVSGVFEFGHPWWVLMFWCSNEVLI